MTASEVEPKESTTESPDLESIEVKYETISSDESDSEISTSHYRSVNEAEANVSVSNTGRNIDRLSMDTFVSTDCAPSNIPVTPQIDSEMNQDEMFEEEIEICEDSKAFIKLESDDDDDDDDYDDTSPSSTGSDLIMINEDMPYCNTDQCHTPMQKPPTKRASLETAPENSVKKQKIDENDKINGNYKNNENDQIVSNQSTGAIGELIYFISLGRWLLNNFGAKPNFCSRPIPRLKNI